MSSEVSCLLTFRNYYDILTVMEDLSEIDELLSNLPNKLNEMWGIITKMANLRYQLLIYKLLRRGHVKMIDLENDTGLSKQRLYSIVDQIDKLIKDNPKPVKGL